MDSHPPRILVIIASRIGDTLLSTPAIRAIAQAYPGADITCLGHPKRIGILDHLPFINRIGTITKNRAPWMGRFGGRRFDWAIVYGFDPALLKYALRVSDKVVAFRQPDPKIDACLFRSVALPESQRTHAAIMSLALPAAMGVPPAGLNLAYHVTDAEQKWAKTTLKYLPTGTFPLIGLQLTSFPTKAYRDWPLEHFIALCDHICEQYPRAHFLIFGSKHRLEKARSDALHQHFLDNSSLFTGLSLRKTAALMAQLNLYIGVDTGPSHIMGSLHRPLVVLYHPALHSGLYGPLEHPCFYPVDHPRAGLDATSDIPMREIDVATVWRQVAAALSDQTPMDDSSTPQMKGAGSLDAASQLLNNARHD